jgi:hypothetical protein
VRQLNGVYAQRFNRRHRRVGHLFQGRYKAVFVEGDGHLLELLRYVVVNPVRARICEHPSEYRWSSYRVTAGLAEPDGLVELERVWGLFASEPVEAQRRYARFVGEGLERGAAPRVRGQIYLGSELFAEQTAQLAPPADEVEVPDEQLDPVRPELPELVEAHGERALLVAYQEHGYRLRELSEFLGCHYSTVSRALARLEQPAGFAGEPAC